jgi:hypothetical protein
LAYFRSTCINLAFTALNYAPELMVTHDNKEIHVYGVVDQLLEYWGILDLPTGPQAGRHNVWALTSSTSLVHADFLHDGIRDGVPINGGVN